MKLWIDDVRPIPEGIYWIARSVNEAKHFIQQFESGDFASFGKFELIDIDHDAGDYVSDGGDYIKLLDWLEETGRNYPIRIHSMNPVGIANMRTVIHRNNWVEIQ